MGGLAHDDQTRKDRANDEAMRYLLLGCFCIMIATSCQVDREPIVQQMIEDEVNLRMDRFLESERKRCLEEIMESASKTADSLLRANPILIKIDSLARPPKVPKPSRPDFERPKDSLSLFTDTTDHIDL